MWERYLCYGKSIHFINMCPACNTYKSCSGTARLFWTLFCPKDGGLLDFTTFNSTDAQDFVVKAGDPIGEQAMYKNCRARLKVTYSLNTYLFLLF